MIDTAVLVRWLVSLTVADIYLLQVDEAGRPFHSILVVNDRLQLDQQLGDTVSSFIAGEMC